MADLDPGGWIRWAALAAVALAASGCSSSVSAPPPSSRTVALIDTGVALDAPDLTCAAAGAPGCPVLEVVQLAGGGDRAHGTNLAGILARGGATLVSLDVFDHGAASVEAVRAAFAWCIANRERLQLRVINLSLGAGVGRAPCPDDALAAAIEEAAGDGLATVVAAGDQGYTEALAVPACAPAAVSVGTAAGDAVAPFSNSAPFLSLLAPGVDVAAGGQVLSGTSQSAAFVSAVAARLAEAHPGDDPAALRARLAAAGTPLRDPRNGVVTPLLSPLPDPARP